MRRSRKSLLALAGLSHCDLCRELAREIRQVQAENRTLRKAPQKIKRIPPRKVDLDMCERMFQMGRNWLT